MDNSIERISQHIKAQWPESEISIIKSDRDHVGPLLSVRSKNNNGIDHLSRSLDHIVVELDSTSDRHFLVIPLGPDGTMPARF